jgi:Tfp pilus assembly protein PilF
MLLCEAGKLEAGFERLSLALELDPTRPYSLVYMARAHALAGETARALEMYSRAEQIHRASAFATSVMRARVRPGAAAGRRRRVARVALPQGSNTNCYCLGWMRETSTFSSHSEP